ncbi:MAG: dephospho-CoA kinase [Clostridia bacterium]|nr:dephospho-CoA kinase [Clostridia bacterium]
MGRVDIKIIGLTGPSGAGKGVVASKLAKLGWAVIDADKVYHSLLIPPSRCLDSIRREFGDGVILPSGELDRRALASIVFAPDAKERLETLNCITHGFVIKEARRLISEYEDMGYSGVVFDAPLLIESGFLTDCDELIVVIASEDIRIQRIMERDGLSRERAEARIKSQPSMEFYISHASYVVENNSDIYSAEAKVAEIYNCIMRS